MVGSTVVGISTSMQGRRPFLTGRAIFHPEQGEPVEIEPGDVLFFPENTRGTWEVIETVRKAYLCYDLRKG